MNVDYENIQRFSTIECAFCGFLFRNKTSLKNHIDSMHNGIKSTPGQLKKSRKCTDLRCMEKGCTCKFYNKQLFISHLKFDHQIDFDIRHLNFTSVDEYSNWKENFELEKNCRYVRVTGCKTLHDGKKLSYYYCNRSTYFTSKSKGVRKRKNPIRVKGLCTASMKEIENNDGSIEILLCATHYGHDTSSEYMKMTKRERDEITELIQQGDHPDLVINAARAKASDSLGRMHMLNRKDIKNIERKLGIRYPGFIKPRRINDLSTDRWISKLQLTSDNPIVFYKPQNVVHESFEFNDLILIFMTSNQQYWINKFGSDGIFMVTEMKMIRAGFYLTVLYVCDEFNVMLPVCFMMCNDSKVYQTFFLNAIYNKIGPIYAKALITDDNYDLYECWTSTMTPVKHIINQRYIDDQIIDKLQNEIEDQDLQHEIYDQICSFFSNSDISTKEEIINYSKNYLRVNDKTKKFGMFFDQMFASRANMWAFCYLKESLDLDKMIDIDTIYNQMLILCENKKNFTPNLSKNINIFFSALLEIQKLKQKKIEEINITISNNHRNATCYNSTLIFPIGKDMWRIKLDDGNDNEFVTVTRKFCKIIDCTVKCEACYDICAHIYECSCNRGEVNICEHVHMLGIFNKRGNQSIDNEVKKEEMEMLDLRTNIVTKLKRILSSIHCVNDEDTLRRISVSLSRADNSVSKARTMTINSLCDEDDYYD
ncbi:Zinc finger C2H2-type [Cinara cedri]|uniref:Zinc finger C2H2-type n=1 Tax=Cinara cedri TaxID=506608 RepID=A0A5E4MIB8_9HEMI|nr:Zinc finger C2H2-type [Cinara cedri]